MKKVLRFLSLSLVLLSLVVVAVVIIGNRPVSSEAATRQFIINPGDGVVTISSRLEKNGMIRNRYVFLFYAYFLGLNDQLKAGRFRLSPSLATEAIVKKLSTGGSQDYWLKIIEGQRLAEIQPKLDSAKEGYVFPDSYLIPEDYTSDQILQIITNNFNQKLEQASANSTTTLPLTDTLTLASLLEREAKTMEAKKIVSGILHHRLQLKMPLQLDATVQYVRDSKFHPSRYWQPISKSDLSLESPYNTYLYSGLPPGPICNPGFDSLYAAFHPTVTDYLFYITGNDGQMHYAKTLAEHNLNIEKYLK